MAHRRYHRYASPDKGYKRTAVISARFFSGGGNSFFKNWVEMGASWELALECGCTVDRPVRWLKPRQPRRPAWKKRHDGEEAAHPAPRFVYHACPKDKP